MVASKFLGLIITFYFFVVLQVFADNFYPARYGKRDDNESRQEKNLSEDRRLGRRDDPSGALTERKIRFFVSGGRYGKRGCGTENCSQGAKESISSGFQTREDRSERIRIPIRKNQFIMGSRFGKRMEYDKASDAETAAAYGKDLKCMYTGISDYYRCLEHEGPPIADPDFLDSSPLNEFF